MAPACRPRSAPGCSSRGRPPRPADGGSASPSHGGSSSSSTAGGCRITPGPLGRGASSCWNFPWGARREGPDVSLPLNPAQDAAVRHAGGPLLVLAGAGSGKTRVLTARIAHLIQQRGVAPQKIFAVTFTNKAAGEMRSRVAALLGADPKGLWIGTFHSLSARLLRREAAALGFGPNFTIYDQDDSESFIKRLLEQRGLSPKANPPRAIHAVISSAKNHMLLPEELGAQAESSLERVAADIYATLGPALRQANAMDFDDLLLHPLTLFPATPGGEPVTLLTAADERDEAEWLAAELARRAAEAGVLYEGMAILYRTNAQSRPLEEAFRFRGIPYRLVGAVSFYERREVKDVLAYLRLIANPADDEAFARIVNVPRRDIGDASVSQLPRAAAQWGRPLLETARAGDRIPDLRLNVREAFQALARLIDELRARFGDADPATALEQVIAAVGYGPYLADEGPEGIERLENVQELIAGAAAWAETATEEGDEAGDEAGEEGRGKGASPIERYLTQAALVTSADQGTGDPTGVTLMTVHMAKGLEWPVVTLAGLEDGLFPLARAAGEPGGLEEERRLCYVGLTRAREKLYLSWARTRYRNGRLELSEPSRFLEAVPAGALEERSTTPLWDRGERTAPARRLVTEFLDTDDSEAERTQDAPRYVAGERVRHRKFGAGIVRTVSGAGRNLKVTVDFGDPDVGTKNLLAAYAGLERDWESA